MPFPRSLRGFLGGALLINAIPHGYHGLTGKPFPSPFATPPGVGNSEPPANLAWSAVNVAASHLLGGRRGGVRPSLASVIAGASVMAVVLAWWFGPEGPAAPSKRR
ncbi:MAG: hypothetical protein ABWZ77_01995 [Naasia sp.]